STRLKPTSFIRDAELVPRIAGLPALSGGVWTLEAEKRRGSDPPAFTCRFLIGRHGHGGGFDQFCGRADALPFFIFLFSFKHKNLSVLWPVCEFSVESG